MIIIKAITGNQFYDWKPMWSIIYILPKNFQEDHINSRRFPRFPGGFLNSSRFQGVLDTLCRCKGNRSDDLTWCAGCGCGSCTKACSEAFPVARTVYGLDMTDRLTEGKLTAEELDSVEGNDNELTLSVNQYTLLFTTSE